VLGRQVGLRRRDRLELDDVLFLAPEDMARLKRIERCSLALPARNISRNGKSLELSVREDAPGLLRSRRARRPAVERGAALAAVRRMGECIRGLGASQLP
jgi:hypothetical protein